MAEERDNGPRPGRVVVTSPRGQAARTVGHAVARDVVEQTELGQVYLRSLVRAQLRLAFAVCGVFCVLLGGLPLLFALVPGARTVAVLGLPLPWLLLGILAYPLLVAGGWFYVRQAERNEREFCDLVERS